MSVQLFRALLSAVVAAALLSACATPQEAADSTVGAAETGSTEVSDGQSSQTSSASYLLGEGDRIGIQVFDEPDLTMESRVGASGVINYSYLGNLKVAGKTAQQIEGEITTLLEDGYLVNPSVNVTVVEFRPFFINGEVRSPGGYPYQPGLTLDKAIALAGGLTDRASTRKMFVIKAGRGSSREVRASMTTRIAPGDIVSIKEGFF